MFFSLAGLWTAKLDDGNSYPMVLPGTLDENGIGGKDFAKGPWHPDITLGRTDVRQSKELPITTRLTRKYTYEGSVSFTKKIFYIPPKGRRIFLEAERARCLRLFIDGKEAAHYIEPSISTPHIFEVTGMLGTDSEIALISDNRYPGLPRGDIVFSSAATDETQTNWNGILGYFRLRTENPVFLSAVRVYPEGESLRIHVRIDSDRFYVGKLTIDCEALPESVCREISVSKGCSDICINNLALDKEVRRWDEYEGNLYELTAGLEGFGKKTVRFGIRRFGDSGRGRLSINGRGIFLRSETNCAVFPEKGYSPMEVESWLVILERYKSYGVNCIRFHSHCPPEASFEAADQIGMLMQPELSHWNPKDSLDSPESFEYYRTELEQVILSLANHPSFVMLTFGNELQPTKTGQKRMNDLLRMAHELDSTRLYANGSNVFYAERGCDAGSDFYTAQGYYQKKLRGAYSGMPEPSEQEKGTHTVHNVKSAVKGYINSQYPNAQTDYKEVMAELRKAYKKPVFSFEAGQYEILPDFDEIEEFHGISVPENLKEIRKRAEEKGLLEVWKKYAEATGEISRIGYREEIEAAMRTEQMSGISLLGLQDFPGQGTALIGMMNSHLEPKPFPFARPEEFRRFFCDRLPLVCLSKYTYLNTEILKAEIKIANYGKHVIEGCLEYELNGADMRFAGRLKEISCPTGRITKAGILEIGLGEIRKAARMALTVNVGEIANTYPIWVYPPVRPVCPESVYETLVFDGEAEAVLDAGGTVYLTPPSDKKSLPQSIQAQFTTDFWSVGTFPLQEGGMGQFIDTEHPIFENFPTEAHTNWQWWPMAVQRAVILPRPLEAIITEMDSFVYMRYMAQLFECRCGNGRLMFSSMGLQNLQQYPEARALLDSIYRYLDSEKFQPRQECSRELFRSLTAKD